MNTLTFTVNVDAPASVIWAIWSDLEGSTEWDTDVADCRLNGVFAPGTHGVCKLKNGLRMAITLEDMVIGQSWSNSARLPGASLRFDHWLHVVTPQTCRVTHQADVSQVTPWLWRKVVRTLLRPALSNSLNNLARLAAKRAEETQSISCPPRTSGEALNHASSRKNSRE